MKRRLGVNLDHVATLRQARQEFYPDPLEAAKIAKKCRADQITLHLREDRRHVQEEDIARVSAAKLLPVNMEMAVTPEMVKLAQKYKPKMVTFVPEKRREVTTEGGLNLKHRASFKVREAVAKLKAKKIHTSLFLDPDARQIKRALNVGADAIEIHTGTYCRLVEEVFHKTGSYKVTKKTPGYDKIQSALDDILAAAVMAKACGMKVYAGHGLHTGNLKAVTKIKEIEEYNIGHAIVARSIFVGLEKAIKEIQKILKG